MAEAASLLSQVFNPPYADIANLPGRSEASTRQLVTRQVR